MGVADPTQCSLVNVWPATDMEGYHREALRKQRVIDRHRELLNTREGREIYANTSKDFEKVSLLESSHILVDHCDDIVLNSVRILITFSDLVDHRDD